MTKKQKQEKQPWLSFGWWYDFVAVSPKKKPRK